MVLVAAKLNGGSIAANAATLRRMVDFLLTGVIWRRTS
jgi:hypothetical protein